MSEERLTYTVDETAALLGISRIHAYRMVGSGKIPSIRLGRRMLIPRLALKKMLAVGEPPSEDA